MTPDPREVIVEYLLSQGMADEGGIYSHAERIEVLLERAGWVLIRKSEVAEAVIVATETRNRIPRLSGPELALSTHRSLDHIIKVLDNPSALSGRCGECKTMLGPNEHGRQFCAMCEQRGSD